MSKFVKVRTLGIPAVVDRLIQQALLQGLQPEFEREFSEHSYGFRPGRNAWQAVQQAQGYIREGRRWWSTLTWKSAAVEYPADRLGS